jgi:hypothetical protein
MTVQTVVRRLWMSSSLARYDPRRGAPEIRHVPDRLRVSWVNTVPAPNSGTAEDLENVFAVVATPSTAVDADISERLIVFHVIVSTQHRLCRLQVKFRDEHL